MASSTDPVSSSALVSRYRQPLFSRNSGRIPGLESIAWDDVFNRGPASMRSLELPSLRDRVVHQLAPAPTEEEAPARQAASTALVSAAPKAPARKAASTAIVAAGSKPAQTVTAEPKKSLWQTLTQRKVIIAASVVLGVVAVGGAAAAAYYFYPVAIAAHAATVGHAGRAVALNTHQLLIRPGFVNTMLMAKLAMQAAVIPAAKASGIVLLPALSTAIVGAIGLFVLLYVANKAWKAAKIAMWGTGSFVVNKFDDQLTQTGLGKGVKWLVGPLVSTAISPIVSALAPDETTPGEPESDEEDSAEDITDVALQPRLQIEGPATKAKVEVTDEAEAVRVEKNRQGKKTQAVTKARKAQAKTESTLAETIIRTSVLAAGLGAVIYFFTKAKPDLNVGQ